MKKIVMFTIVLLFTAGLAAYAKDYMFVKKAGSYMVHVMMDKNPPVAGQNKMEISIQDAAGTNVTDAEVNVEYAMPAMPGMPAMHYKTKAELSGSRYLANVNFSMAGAWSVTIKITHAGKTQPVKFNVDVS
ncbi:MAG TPA: FixH family protein [Syntrophales bacterium]|nr:FixH family protein [Syntrophales bacterium]